MEKMAGNCKDDGNAVRQKYYEQRTLIFPDGIQVTQVFDAPTFRRIDNGDAELIAQIRKKNFDESLGSGAGLIAMPTAGPSTASDWQDNTSIGDVEENGSNYVFWTKPATNLLITLYEENEEEFENPRKKKDVWREITEKLNEAGYEFSQLKVENKRRSLAQSHENLKDSKKNVSIF